MKRIVFIAIALGGLVLSGGAIMAQQVQEEPNTDVKKLPIHLTPTNQVDVSIHNKDVAESAQDRSDCSVFAPLYTAEGILTMETVNGEKSKKDTADFSISVGNHERWWIALSQKMGPIESTEYMACDGTNIFHLFGKPQNVSAGIPGVVTGDLVTKNTVTYHLNKDVSIPIMPLAEISSGLVPITYNRFGLLWLAFVGSDYLSTKGETDRIPNLLDLAPINSPFSWCTRFHYTNVNDTTFPLLRGGSFIVDTHLLSDDLVDYPKVKEPEEVKSFERLKKQLEIMCQIPSEYFLRGSYTLNQSVQVGTIKVPALFSAANRSSILFPQDDISGIRFIGCVTNVVVNALPHYTVPKIEGEITVHDFRFMKRTKEGYANNIIYKCTNSWELDTSSEKLKIAGADVSVRRKNADTSKRPPVNYLSMGLIVLLVALPISLVYLKRK